MFFHKKVALYRAVVECERNSLVYLPRGRGLGRTLLAGMVMRRLLDLNPQRQAFFLVEMEAQVSKPVRTGSGLDTINQDTFNQEKKATVFLQSSEGGGRSCRVWLKGRQP